MNTIEAFEGLDERILSLIFHYPRFSKPEDEVGENTLVKWITVQYLDLHHSKIQKHDIFGCI